MSNNRSQHSKPREMIQQKPNQNNQPKKEVKINKHEEDKEEQKEEEKEEAKIYFPDNHQNNNPNYRLPYSNFDNNPVPKMASND